MKNTLKTSIVASVVTLALVQSAYATGSHDNNGGLVNLGGNGGLVNIGGNGGLINIGGNNNSGSLIDLDVLNGNVTQIGANVGVLNGRVDGLEQTVTTGGALLNDRIDKLTSSVGTAYDTLDGKINNVQDLAIDARATAGNALDTVYGLIPQTLNNAKAIADVDNKVDTAVAAGVQVAGALNNKIDGVDAKVNDLAQQGQAAYTELKSDVASANGRIDDTIAAVANVEAKANTGIALGAAANLKADLVGAGLIANTVWDAHQQKEIDANAKGLAANNAVDAKQQKQIDGNSKAIGGLQSGLAANTANDAKQQQQIDKVQAGLNYTDRVVAQNTSDIADTRSGLKDLAGTVETNKAAQADRDLGQDVRMDGIEKQAANNDGRIGAVEVRADNLEQGQRDLQAQNEVTDARSIDNADRISNLVDVTDKDRTDINNRVDGVSTQVNKNTNDIANVSNVANDAYNNAYNAQQTANAGVAIGQDAKNTAINAQNTADYAVGQTQKNGNDIINLDNRVTGNTSAIQKTQNDLINTNNVLTQNVKQTQSNTNRITNVEGTVATHTTQIANHETRITNNETSITKNTSDIKETQKVVNNQGKVINNHETRITNNETNISTLNQDFNSFSQTVNNNQEITNYNIRQGNAQTLSQSKNYTDNKFGEMKQYVDKGRSDDQKEYRSGIAGVAAMANIPNVPGTTFSLGAGMGQYKDQTALAVGGNWNVSQRVAVKASVGFTNEDATAGAGIAFGF
ncbi:putative autoagglutinating Adhesin [Erwinia phage vB_EamM_Yoloswag]|uniref:Putative autoagglutinating Adhesin n=1 Tax=Erwinia phage vB_EamM_Yoloswag TaxID=1958956 RepID=A0A1S6L3H6_9CAUD|nr:tail protein [Erwinia phage vB_EamM_Yoloswag]AQT28733.1 putative autoagglutinating Adhesin [Erwinia phage vB_EamM_Yoloswag]